MYNDVNVYDIDPCSALEDTSSKVSTRRTNKNPFIIQTTRARVDWTKPTMTKREFNSHLLRRFAFDGYSNL
jgi:hypothetical protein